MMRLQLHFSRNEWLARTVLNVGCLFTALFADSCLTRIAISSEISIDRDYQPQLLPKGTLFICGGGSLPWKVTDRFIQLAGGKNARIVIVSSASYYADHDIECRLSGWFDRLAENCFASLDILHTRSREEADRPEFSSVLESATALWFIGGNQNWLAQTYLGTKTEERMHAILSRGGVVGGSSAGAAIMSRCMIAEGKTEPILASGFGFMPGTIVDQHFRKRNRFERLARAMEMRPGLVGIGIDEGTALIVRGRTLEAIGDSDVCLCLGHSSERQEKTCYLASGERADLVAWRRAACSRAGLMATSTAGHTPEVQNGTLVIVGGGATPREAVDEFLSAAGGMESPIVVVSNALGETLPDQDAVCNWLRVAGARNVCMIHTASDEDLASPKLLELLKEARGIWFAGGRQWRLVDAFLDTHVETLFHDVLRRGGVIGGTSAGATIQGEYLVRGNPISNEEVSAEGYERGFSFLPGVAIDQHFTQRERLDDLTQLKKSHPELIGLGVDESTALIVRGTTMQVVGQHNVTIFDRQPTASTDSSEYDVLKPGERYDLRQHRRVETLTTDATTPSK